MGYVYDDGPPPLGLRYQVNSASLVFEKKPWFEVPELSKLKRRNLARQRVAQAEKMDMYNELLRDEERMGIPSLKERM